MAVSTTFQTRLCNLVDESDYTRTELRELLKISSTSFTNALIYGIIPTPKTLIKLADFFDVSLSYLLGKVDSDNFIKSNLNQNFCDRLTLLLDESGISRYKLAQECLFDKSLISRWFAKGYLPSLDILEILSNYFGVSTDYLLGRSDFKN